MSLPLSFYKSTVAGSFAARGVEAPRGTVAPMTATQQITAGFMAPAKKEFSAVAFFKDLAIVSVRHARHTPCGSSSPPFARPVINMRDDDAVSAAFRSP